MKSDVLDLVAGRHPRNGPSKETLNHPGLIELVTGLDPYADAPRAFRRAYAKLGIDIINRVPDRPAPPPAPKGETRDLGNGYVAAHLGVYDTVTRHDYPFSSVDEFLDADLDDINLDYSKLMTPVPHTPDPDDIRHRQSLLGDIGIYYYQIYTTLFMWGVEYLGWEVFLLAGGLAPDTLDRLLLQPGFEASRRIITTLSLTECPFVFCHDDLADKRGPVFPPEWYETYIFPRYPGLFAPAKAAGKKVIFVADGNMEPFFESILSADVDGVMFENPATNFEAILQAFGDRIIIGGIDTGLLQSGTPEAIRNHVFEVNEKTAETPGFVMSTPGGLHGNLPLENLIAYFDARVESRHTLKDWKL